MTLAIFNHEDYVFKEVKILFHHQRIHFKTHMRMIILIKPESHLEFICITLFAKHFKYISFKVNLSFSLTEGKFKMDFYILNYSAEAPLMVSIK